ncbi:MAG: hypothetical protein PWP23_731 [Candidatus Sumerlaeota bacterium]|nr:hypothetical protein [Candidatus Sumerlaeota bacterium]
MTDPSYPSYQVPSGIDPSYGQYALGVDPRSGPAWEDPNLGLVSRLVETVKPVFARPTEFFRTMRLEGDFLKPLYFGVIMSSVVAFAVMLLQVVIQGITLIPALASGRNTEDAIAGFAIFAGTMLCTLVLTPLFAAGGLFMQAGILHLCLMIVGGANKGFEATFRVCCYAAAINLLAIIPCVGGYIAGPWMIVAQILGVINTHETDTWRGVMAVLLPIIVCCGGMLLLVALVIGVGGVAAALGQ